MAGNDNGSLTLALADAVLEGALVLPPGASAIVAFAHGSGSSRFSPRNRAAAQVFNRAGIGTLLFDLLSPEEKSLDEVTQEFRFNIALLSQRLAGVIDWLRRQPRTGHLHLGLFGAETGAAAVLIAAAEHPDLVRAVVCRGGRPDLAGRFLPKVQAPSLLIVGERDTSLLALNRQAAGQISCQHQLEIIAGASHLFEEAGTLDRVQQLASNWFVTWLVAGHSPETGP